MNGKQLLAFMLALLMAASFGCGTANMFGGNKAAGSPDTDAMLIIGSGWIYWTNDRSFAADTEHMLDPVDCMLDYMRQGEGNSSITGNSPLSIDPPGKIYVFSDLKPGRYRMGGLSTKYLIKSGDQKANPPIDAEYASFMYEFPESDYPELVIDLSPGQIEFIGAIYLKTKHPSSGLSGPIRRGADESAFSLDRADEAYVIHKVLEKHKDGPWAQRLRAKLREIVDARVFSLSHAQ